MGSSGLSWYTCVYQRARSMHTSQGAVRTSWRSLLTRSVHPFPEGGEGSGVSAFSTFSADSVSAASVMARVSPVLSSVLFSSDL